MQEEEIADFWQLNEALVMQVSLTSRSLPTWGKNQDKILKEFFRLHSELFFLNHQILALLKFNEIEQIKDIKVVLGSFRLKRICYGKPAPLTWGLDQIYCSANSVTSFIALSVSQTLYTVSVEVVRKEFAKVQKFAGALHLVCQIPVVICIAHLEYMDSLIHWILPYEYLITLKWLTFTDPHFF